MKLNKIYSAVRYFSLICLLLAFGSVRGQIITTWAGNGAWATSGGEGGPATAVGATPAFMAKDAAGNIYVTEQYNAIIHKISPSGILSVVAGTLNTNGFSGDGGAATAATLNQPKGIVVDAAGNIYFTDQGNSRIRKISTSGIITTIAGTGANGFSGDGGPATAAKLNLPWGLAMDASGNLFICDTYNLRIRKISTSGIITTVAGSDNPVSYSDSVGATSVGLQTPFTIALDATGNIYYSENYSFRVRKISPSGLLTIVMGNGVNAAPADTGMATASPLYSPSGLCLDNSGNLYVSINGNYNVIRKINLSTGRISAVAGSGSIGYSGDGGPATAAQLSNPTGLIFDNTGDLLVADLDNKRLRKIACSHLDVTLSGASTVCLGTSTTLSASMAGGTWSSSSASIASVSSAGVVRGNSAGVTTISYSVASSCGITTVTKSVTVNTVPSVAAIGGTTSSVCAGANITLTEATTGGVWSSSAATIASVSAAGVVRGNATGIATISYAVTNTCGTTVVTKAVTVNTVPTVATTLGSSALCAGNTLPLSNATPGGVWNSSDPAIASVSAAGVVTGIAAGNVTISYVVTNTCGSVAATKPLLVAPGTTTVAAIAGASSVCVGATTSLTNTTSGGVWSSSNTGIASVSATGLVSGIAAGTATISYYVTGSCGSALATKVVTVNTAPVIANITGSSVVCVGANITLTDTVAGGVWSSSAPAVASISATGVVRGNAAGSVTINYTITNACGMMVAFKDVAVNAAATVAAISGTSAVCTGANITLTNATTGGVWSSSAATIASVSATGVVRGNAAGTATISYVVSGSCGNASATKVVTVNPATSVASISGASTVCTGVNITLTNTTTGGTWSSSAPTKASVSSAGVVRGNAAGTATISYAVTGACGNTVVTKAVTVNAAPTVSAITGTSSVAAGASTTLTSTGTTWSSSNTSIATVNASTGVVTGIAAGTATITCSATNTCGTTYVTYAVTVAAPAASTYGISTYAGTGTLGFSGDGGAASSAQFSYPYAVAASSTGNVYVVDQLNNRIRKITSAGIISTIAGTGTYGNTGDGGAATAATLANPQGVAVDAAGNVYVADYGNNRIRKISTTGIISNFAGSGTGIDGGAATTADVYHPAAVAVDASGNVYIAETGNNRVRKVNTSGIISTIAGTGVSGYSGDAGAATAAKLSSPYGVTVDASGNVYIADLGNNRIRKVSGGVISTVAGTGVAGFSGDGGAATSANINTPYGMTMDASGNMYICDYNNFRIRRVSATCTISTIAGTGNPAYGGDGGMATLADLNRPTGIAVDASGNIYVADNNNQRVRKLAACTAPVSGTITGPATVVMGNNITLSTTGTGGTWSSVFTAKATVAASGMVHAISAGIDTIKYTVTNGCGTARSVYVINITTSKPGGNNAADPATEAAVLNVYPNPSNGLLNLEIARGSTISMVQVFNVSGRLMQQASGTGNTQQINISDYPSGMYIIRVLQEDGQTSQVRVVKE